MATCRFPLAAFQLANGEVVFRERTGQDSVRSLFLPCGRCALCRRERSRQWAVRCMHEAKLYDQNCFITLTYDEAHLPVDRSLKYSDYAAFMRRLRKYVGKLRDLRVSPVRFYMCGEYGGLTSRPHYHACLFNWDFSDKLYFKSVGGFKLYTSECLSSLWAHGSHLIGSVTFESAAYVARYCMDKVTGDLAKAHYEWFDRESGEVFSRAPEFNRCSTKPGIGAPWLKRFLADVYPNGNIVAAGRLAKAPRYYDKIFKRSASAEELEVFIQKRWEMSQIAHPEDMTDARLEVKEKVMLARLSQFKRSL